MSSILAEANRKFQIELNNMVNREVQIVTTDNIFRGVLLAVDTQLNLILSDAIDRDGNKFYRILITYPTIKYVMLREVYLSLRDFARYLEKFFPGMVKYVEEANVVLVGDKVRVTEAGVEGFGPVAERVKKVLEEFLGSTRR